MLESLFAVDKGGVRRSEVKFRNTRICKGGEDATSTQRRPYYKGDEKLKINIKGNGWAIIAGEFVEYSRRDRR